jgi:tetratricopeptide (TPR) repeat protein
MHLTAEDLSALLGINSRMGLPSSTPDERIAVIGHLLACARCRRLLSVSLFDLQAPESPVDAENRPDEGISISTVETVLLRAIDRLREDENPPVRPEATQLAEALLELPDHLRLDAIESQRRFHNPELVPILLKAARSSHDPISSRHLARLAAAVLGFQNATSRRQRTEAAIGCLLADAERRFGKLDLAEDIFRDAAQALCDQPLIIEERVVLCRTWAALRHEQRRIDEALGLLEHGAAVAEDLASYQELALTRLAYGWLLLDEFDPERSILPLKEAIALTEQGEDLQTAFSALHALALAFAELGDEAALESTLNDLGHLVASFPDPMDAVRVRWIRAKAEIRRNVVSAALSEMEAVFASMIRLGPGFEAAQAGIELALMACEYRTKEEDSSVRQTLERIKRDILDLPEDRLAAHLRPPLQFALDFAIKRIGGYIDCLLGASQYLERARFNPDYPYHPSPVADRILLWRELNRDQRHKAAQAAGVPSTALDAFGYPKDPQDFLRISWTHEALTGARIQLPFDLSELGEETRV